MARFKAKDGHPFATAMQMRKYEEASGNLQRDSLADLAKARGGPSHTDDITQHGIAKEVIIRREGNGRTSVTATLADGFKHESVHPETYRAHDIGRELLGIEPPPALQTHSRSRAQPRGPKEEERQDKEDNREIEEGPDANF